MPASAERGVRALVAQRIYGLAPGYEDLNEYASLRHDALLALLVGTADPPGGGRRTVELLPNIVGQDDDVILR